MTECGAVVAARAAVRRIDRDDLAARRALRLTGRALARAVDALTTGAARVTPGTARSRRVRLSKSGKGPPMARTVTWPLRPRMLLRSSCRKPFITDITMIRVATPSAIPTREKPEITEIKLSCRLALR